MVIICIFSISQKWSQLSNIWMQLCHCWCELNLFWKKCIYTTKQKILSKGKYMLSMFNYNQQWFSIVSNTKFLVSQIGHFQIIINKYVHYCIQGVVHLLAWKNMFFCCFFNPPKHHTRHSNNLTTQTDNQLESWNNCKYYPNNQTEPVQQKILQSIL